MADRLSTLDASFLYLETPTTPMHVGSVAVLEPTDGGTVDHERLVEVVEQRIALVPRFRQRVRTVPGRLANPVWVDDEQFDIAYHVRRSALPRPGTDQQLKELVGRLMGRPLARDRPLWEVYLVEGLSGGRVGIITKTHAAVVDGVAAVDLVTVLLDVSPTPRDVPVEPWQPERAPGHLGLVAGAVSELARRPTAAVDALRTNAVDVRTTAGRIAGVAGTLVAGSLRVARSAPDSPLNATIGEQRRFALVRTRLEDHRAVRQAHGSTVNDVVLATVAGALRTWLLTRGEAVTGATSVRAMVPVAVRAGQGELGNRVGAWFVDLPVGEGNPVVRLHQVGFGMRGHQESGRSVGAEALQQLSGFAPPTIHALGARVAGSLSKRLFNVAITNVPGPQYPLYAAGARLLEMFPVVPLAKDQALSIGVTSYDGGLYYGLNADRDAMPDVEVLAACLEESLAELVGTVGA